MDPNLAPIENLNNDCLLSVFELLSVAERVTDERVCKRWQIVAKESWSNVKSIHFNDKSLEIQ